MFEKKEADKLTPYQEGYNIRIDLESDKIPNFGLLYSILWGELQVLHEYLDKQLAKGFIWSSYSLFISSILFAKKPEEGLYFCINYWALNIITVWNQYPIPLIQEILDQLLKV